MGRNVVTSDSQMTDQTRPATLGWFDAALSRFAGAANGEACFDKHLFTDSCNRSLIVAKIRWLLVVLLSLYGICSGVLYSLSPYGFFLTLPQIAVVFLSLCTVVVYNILLTCNCATLKRYTWLHPAQILLDFMFVTVLVHFSGGASSWFWPVYLVVTIEATFLLEKTAAVWLIGASGSLMFGALLVGEYLDVIPVAGMPFVTEALHHDSLYVLLVWMWVAILNAIMAIIGSFLMTVIRRENRALRNAEDRLVGFLDAANDLIFSVDTDGRFLYVNSAWMNAL